MKEPTFKPEQWITYQDGIGGGFGRIVGGVFENEAWVYTVAGASANGEHTQVAEASIIYLLQNNSWLAPTSFGGQGSVYSNTAEEA